jgi:hypothetical protein
MANDREHWLVKVHTNLDDLSVSIKNATGNEVKKVLSKAVEEKDVEFIAEMLDYAWRVAPDNPVIHTWPKWEVLCDLLSEAPK